MGLFDIFKKKQEPDYNPLNVTVRDLDEGFIFDYNLKSWVVKEVYEYDWGNNNFTKEVLADSGDEKIYLGVEEDGDLFLTISKPEKIRKIDEDLVDKIVDEGKPPKKLDFEGVKYFFDEDSAGYFHNKTKGGDDWEELVSFEYYNDDEDKLINITQWGDRDFEASVGVVVKEYEISNIIQGVRS